MKFTVTSLVSSVNSGLLPEAEKVTKEVVVANPRATLQNLRATVAIQFRLNVVAFDFHFARRAATAAAAAAAPAGNEAAPAPSSSSSPAESSAAAVDLSDEKKLLTECGLCDGDHLTVLPKHHRPSATLRGSAEATGVAQADAESYGGPSKKARVEAGEDAPDATTPADEEDEGEDSISDEEEGEEEEDEEDESDEEGAGQNDLFEALRDVVPDLTVLRQEFLANPQAVMERIERNHPSLFQVITQNQETFVRLMNNEQLTKAAQSMLHGRPVIGGDSDDEEQSVEWSMGGEEEDEEMDEETEAQMRELFGHYIAAGGAGGDFDAADLAALEASGMEVADVDDPPNGGDDGSGGAQATGAAVKKATSEKDFILARVPTEDDEKKIQALTELGFSYEQCKLAFYLCHRSIDRASNLLFEAPPEI